MTLAFVAMGSNLSPVAHLGQAVEALTGWCRLVQGSRVYQTPPWGYAHQPDFLNAVVCLETDLSPQDLLAQLGALETRLGRSRQIHNGPRTLDLDLLCHGQTLLDGPDLVLPHPRMHLRDFVLIPLCDVAPTLIHPRLGVSMQRLLASLPTPQAQATPWHILKMPKHSQEREATLKG